MTEPRTRMNFAYHRNLHVEIWLLLGSVDDVVGPLQGLSTRSIRAAWRQRDLRALPRVEPVSVAELLPECRAHPQSVPGVDPDISAVEQRVDVGSEEQTVVQAVPPALCDRGDVRCFENGVKLCRP